MRLQSLGPLLCRGDEEWEEDAGEGEGRGCLGLCSVCPSWTLASSVQSVPATAAYISPSFQSLFSPALDPWHDLGDLLLLLLLTTTTTVTITLSE